MELFQPGDFTLNSGAKSKWKLECDALTDGDISTLATMIQQLVGPFMAVTGVPRGGLRLERALAPLTTDHGCHLIVDDVLTTGGSMDRLVRSRWPATCQDLLQDGFVVGAVIFARGQCPPWIKAVFQMPPAFWMGAQGWK